MLLSWLGMNGDGYPRSRMTPGEQNLTLKSQQQTETTVIFCCHPGIYASVVLKELLKSPKITLAGVVLSSRLMSKSRPLLLEIPRLIKVTGLRYSCYQGLVTVGHSLFSSIMGLPTVDKLCRKHNLPTLTTRDINSDTGVAFVAGKSPDFLLAANFNQKIGVELLSLPAKGSINLHPSLLPDYRGVDPVLAAIAEGEQEYGITLHQMDEAFDTGAILDQQRFPISSDDCLFEHYVRVFRQGARMARHYIESGGKGYSLTSQANAGRYFGWPTPQQVSCAGRLVRFKRFFADNAT